MHTPHPFVDRIYTLVATLLPFINTVGTDYSIAWTPRDRAVTRLNRIIQALLGLTARTNPERIGASFFAPLRPLPRRETPRAPVARAPRLPGRLYPKRRLSPRETAIRLADLFRQLGDVTREIGHTLSPEILALCEDVRIAAGCHALAPQVQDPAQAPAQAQATAPRTSERHHPDTQPTQATSPAATPGSTPEPTRTLDL